MTFEELYKEYYDRVRWHCRRVLGSNEHMDDAAQKTFTQAHDVMQHGVEIKNWWGWLKNTAHARCTDIVRSENKARERERAYVMKLDGDRASHLDRIRAGRVAGFIPYIGDPYGKALHLVYIEGKKQKVAAKEMDLPYGYFRVVLQRGRDKLRELIDKVEDLVDG